MSAVIEKARRLRDHGCVRELPTNARAFQVRGDHGTYLVTIDGDHWTCSCPATGACSHVFAVCVQLNAERTPPIDPFAGTGTTSRAYDATDPHTWPDPSGEHPPHLRDPRDEG